MKAATIEMERKPNGIRGYLVMEQFRNLIGVIRTAMQWRSSRNVSDERRYMDQTSDHVACDRNSPVALLLSDNSIAIARNAYQKLSSCSFIYRSFKTRKSLMLLHCSTSTRASQPVPSVSTEGLRYIFLPFLFITGYSRLI